MIIEKPVRRMETLMARRYRSAFKPSFKRFLGTLPKADLERRCLALAREMKVPL